MEPALSFSLIQTNLYWEDKAANLAMLQEKIQKLPSTEVVVLPEMFSTGFSMRSKDLAETMAGSTVNWMKEIAASKKVVLTGSVIIEEENEYFNRLLWVLPDGRVGHYDKRHLFAYGGEHEKYSAGNKRLIASVKGWRINLQVCYDLRFPVWARQEMVDMPEYDVLLYVANWPERRIHAWKTLLQARAIENQCYTIGVNRVGDDGNQIYHSGESMVVDPLGEVWYHKKNEEDSFTITLQKDTLTGARERYPFLDDADEFKILL
jgi:omega-amidase